MFTFQMSLPVFINWLTLIFLLFYKMMEPRDKRKSSSLKKQTMFLINNQQIERYRIDKKDFRQENEQNKKNGYAKVSSTGKVFSFLFVFFYSHSLPPYTRISAVQGSLRKLRPASSPIVLDALSFHVSTNFRSESMLHTSLVCSQYPSV